MTEVRGWSLPESHLLPDVIVAFVDGELRPGAQDRAAAHLARCPGCAAEVRAQRQACAEVRSAGAPAMSPGFLASLQSIPEHAELPAAPDNLAISEDGQLVAIQRPDRVAGLAPGTVLGGGRPLGSSAPLGNSPGVLGGSARSRRRASQGAGVVVSGLVLSALALVASSGGDSNEVANDPGPQGPAGVNVLRAQFGPPVSSPSPVAPPPATSPVSSTSPASGVSSVPGQPPVHGR